jgi:hypothetical protein
VNSEPAGPLPMTPTREPLSSLSVSGLPDASGATGHSSFVTRSFSFRPRKKPLTPRITSAPEISVRRQTAT